MTLPVTYVELSVVVVAPFSIGGVGRGACITDPAGVLVGLHMCDPTAS
jgi:predicted enzyme related to lactoylglutathione lyase